MILSIPPVWLWLHDQMLCIVSHSSSQLLTAIETLCHHIRENRKKREGEACCFCISKGQRQKKKKKENPHTRGSTLDGEMVEIEYLLGQDHQMHSSQWTHNKITRY